MSTNQESPIKERLATIRLSFPTEDLDNVVRMRLIGRDLLLYVKEDQINTVISTFTAHGLKPVDRVYKLHVSAPTKADFDASFGKVEYEERSAAGRFIATVTVDTEEEYNKFLDLGKDQESKCRVKAFRARFANAHEEKEENVKQENPVQHGPSQRQFPQHMNSDIGRVSKPKYQGRGKQISHSRRGRKGTQ